MKHIAPLIIITALSLVLIACQDETEPTAIPEPVEEAATVLAEPTAGKMPFESRKSLPTFT